jgi:hypothetical protein
MGRAKPNTGKPTKEDQRKTDTQASNPLTKESPNESNNHAFSEEGPSK